MGLKSADIAWRDDIRILDVNNAKSYLHVLTISQIDIVLIYIKGVEFILCH